MGQRYDQLSLEERCILAELRCSGRSIREIASTLDRQPSTICPELKRNMGQGPRAGPYRAAYAAQQAAARRWSGSRLDRNAALREEVLQRLSAGYSPAQVSGRLKREHGKAVIGHEAIYRFIYDQLKRTNDGAWRHYLPRARFKRGWRPQRGGSPEFHIRQRVSISERPASANSRQQPGHWEADFMLFGKYGQSVLVLHERTTRLTAFVRTKDRKAKPTADHLAKLLEPLPQPLRRSVTFDNGTEFAEHHQLASSQGLATFFCDPHKPWQKGGIENAIGRMRRYLPRKTDLETLTDEHFLNLSRLYNHIPRKCLDFQTPAEAFSKVLHFERDSTYRPSPV